MRAETMELETTTDTGLRRDRRGPAEKLRAALSDLAGGKAEITAHKQQPWASITFSGARHALDLLFEGEEAMRAAEHFIAALPDHEFTVPGQLVADATIGSVDHTLLPIPRMIIRAELLLLEDG